MSAGQGSLAVETRSLYGSSWSGKQVAGLTGEGALAVL
jgi:hypothetical protein